VQRQKRGEEPATRYSTGRRILLRGTVQGVGFRPFVRRTALAHGLVGSVRNEASGVTIEVFGEPGSLDGFIETLRSAVPHGVEISSLRCEDLVAEAPRGFTIESSEARGGVELSVAPDRAACDDCLRETGDPGDRRFGWAFTSCTSCGPRYTIALGVPYDRSTTTMSRFEPCAACRCEFEDPDDRRFHSETNACPDCGPSLRLVDDAGRPLASDDPIDEVARAIRLGRIVSVKGLGGHHLVCDATSEKAVATLRERKHRDEKPFAVMVRDLSEAQALAEIEDTECSLLVSPERPIVLVRRRSGARIAPGIAPGLPLVGLFLPYTPLHHRLLAAVGGPVVMTSANRSGEPIPFRDPDADATLAPLADLRLGHDREIAAPCEDSVARVIDRVPVLLRRGRGFVPRAIAVDRPFARPVLACGADLKNTVAIGVGDRIWLGPHQGDLESLASYEALEQCVERLCDLLQVRPEIVAHDLHPGFLTTRFAREWPARERVAVQHHHAHAASALAEHAIGTRALALVWDGTGDGGDGTSWGGELLIVDAERAERLGTFRPIRLAGGDAAIRSVWRAALALLDDAFDGSPPLDALGLFRHVPPEEIALVRRLVATPSLAPAAHGVGRLFDAVGALLLERREARFEGQVALGLGELAGGPAAPYSFAIDAASALMTIDLRPAIRELVAERLGGRPGESISARWHQTLVSAGAALVRRASEREGLLPVLLTGGCFANPRLAEGLRQSLCEGRTVHLHRELPPGDGGISVGQALVANARIGACV
jgi:hydrogenase maturation protein HypF